MFIYYMRKKSCELLGPN